VEVPPLWPSLSEELKRSDLPQDIVVGGGHLVHAGGAQRPHCRQVGQAATWGRDETEGRYDILV